MAESELAAARRDGEQALEWLKRFNSPGAFGWDHRLAGYDEVGGGHQPGASAEHRAKLDLINAKTREVETLRQRLANEVWQARTGLVARFPVLSFVVVDLELEPA